MFRFVLFLTSLIFATTVWAQNTRDWPSVNGELVSAYVKEVPGGKGFTLDVKYTYAVADTPFTGIRYRADGPAFADREAALSALKTLQTSVPLKVYYNPVNPGMSVLTR